MKNMRIYILIVLFTAIIAIPDSAQSDVRLHGEVILYQLTGDSIEDIEDWKLEKKQIEFFMDIPLECNKYYIEHELGPILQGGGEEKQTVSWDGEVLYMIVDYSSSYNERQKGKMEEMIINSGQANLFNQKYPDGRMRVPGAIYSSLWYLFESDALLESGQTVYVGGYIMDRGDANKHQTQRRDHSLNLYYRAKFDADTRLLESIEYYPAEHDADIVAKVNYMGYHDYLLGGFKIPKEINIQNYMYTAQKRKHLSKSDMAVFIHEISEISRENYTPEPPGNGVTVVVDHRTGLDCLVTYNVKESWPSVEKVKKTDEYQDALAMYNSYEPVGKYSRPGKTNKIILLLGVASIGIALFVVITKYLTNGNSERVNK